MEETVVIVGGNARSSRKHHLIAVGQMASGLYHRRKIVFYLLQATACKEGYHGEPVVIGDIQSAVVGSAKLAHLVGSGIAHIMNGIVVLPLIEWHLEGKDGIHL